MPARASAAAPAPASVPRSVRRTRPRRRRSRTDVLQAQPLLPDPVAAVPATLYARLIDGASPDLDAFDAHLLACILTIAATETVAQPLTEAVGLQPDALAVMLAGCFPRIAGALGSYAARGFALAADEASLVDHCSRPRADPSRVTGSRRWLRGGPSGPII